VNYSTLFTLLFFCYYPFHTFLCCYFSFWRYCLNATLCLIHTGFRDVNTENSNSFTVLSVVKKSRCSEQEFRSSSEGLFLNACKVASLADGDAYRIMLWNRLDVTTFSGWFPNINSPWKSDLVQLWQSGLMTCRTWSPWLHHLRWFHSTSACMQTLILT
jgi:hypothetical protein